MAEEEKESPPENEGGGKKETLEQRWKHLKGWEKIGVIIAGATLAFLVYQYVKNNQAGSSGYSGGGMLPGGAGSVGSGSGNGGNVGPQGPAGPAGPTGPTGATGPQGPAGPPASSGGSGNQNGEPFPAFGDLAFNTLPALLPGGYTVNYSGGGNYKKGDVLAMQNSNPWNIVDLTQLFGITNFQPGGQGRVWYTPPGQKNQQLLEQPGSQGFLNNPSGPGWPTGNNPQANPLIVNGHYNPAL